MMVPRPYNNSSMLLGLYNIGQCYLQFYKDNWLVNFLHVQDFKFLFPNLSFFSSLKDSYRD